jgi:hypothetical protein
MKISDIITRDELKKLFEAQLYAMGEIYKYEWIERNPDSDYSEFEELICNVIKITESIEEIQKFVENNKDKDKNGLKETIQEYLYDFLVFDDQIFSKIVN